MFPVGTAELANMPGMSSDAHIHPSEVWNEGSRAPTGVVKNGDEAQSYHQALVQGRLETVAQRYGQITPPDDNTPSVSNKRKDSARTASSPDTATLSLIHI